MTIEVTDLFYYDSVSLSCFDDGGINHMETRYPSHQVPMPKEVKTIKDAIAFLDDKRAKADKHECKSCGRGGMVWSNLRRIHTRVVTTEISNEQIIRARKRMADAASK